MQTLAENIWVHDDMVLREDDRKLPLRLTVVRLTDGKLWLHAPTPLSEELKESIGELGTVGHLFCGNNLHNTWYMDWVQAYPDAEAWVTPGIPAKLTELRNYSVLDGNPWATDFDTASMQRVPFFDETVFLHRLSKSLIVTDMVQNHIRRGVFIAPPLLREDFIEDRDAFKGFVNQISAWDFERIVITHGAVIEESAKEEFQRICEPFL